MKSSIVVLLVALTAVSPLFAASSSERLDILERRMDMVTDLLIRVENLQLENNQLRGELDVLRNEMETLKTQQREMYLDIERRLGNKRSDFQQPPAAQDSDQRLTPASDTPVQQPEEAQYQAALELLINKHDPQAAIPAFKAHIERFSHGEYADNARFWLAEAHYNANDLDGAIREFQTLIESHPQSPKVPDALYKIGHIRSLEDESEKSRQVFNGLIQHYPDSQAAALAAKRLSSS